MSKIKNIRYFCSKNEHKFHEKCIKEWSDRVNSCPVCREKLNIPDINDGYLKKKLSQATLDEIGYNPNARYFIATFNCRNNKFISKYYTNI